MITWSRSRSRSPLWSKHKKSSNRCDQNTANLVKADREGDSSLTGSARKRVVGVLLGTPGDTLQLRDKLHKTMAHIGQFVKDTSHKLKQASETDHHAQVTVVKKIADAKLAKDFQAVLKEFQKTQRLAAERETRPDPWRLTDGAIGRCRSSD
ncbi:hypothetical protein C1H46_011633 [Malus baccata]|uniref:Syntaxin N-terminal domain-containing protein n=1 Tax=Malus baccata TaxID=106549 RepID=A0A540MVI4_MALBA|nr:hypothetical protein C1H46_011630 [Malus baccata]TQE02804.1 hypothetical protein C1H46_011633 [Malus baccata]